MLGIIKIEVYKVTVDLQQRNRSDFQIRTDIPAKWRFWKAWPFFCQFDWLLRAQWSKNALVRFLIPFWAGIELTRIVPIFLDQTWSGFVWNLGLSKMFSFVYSSNSEDLIGDFQRNHCKLVWYFNNRKIVLMLHGIFFGAKIVCRQKNVSPQILRAMCTLYILSAHRT